MPFFARVSVVGLLLTIPAPTQTGVDTGDLSPSPPTAHRQFEERLSSAIDSLCLAILDKWIGFADPNSVLSYLQTNFPESLQALAEHGDDQTRRRFLARVIDRLAATPGLSDVDVLCGAIDWIAQFHLNQDANETQFDSVTSDLILLFTDRSPNGLTLADAGHYRAGRFLDRGFADSLRDGTDQVRHFAWAVRLFATSTNMEQTNAILRLKEIRDAVLRNEPLNEADLNLNEAARQVAEAIRADKNMTATSYAALVRKAIAQVQ